MGRHPLIRSNHLPYHLYGRSNNREWFYLDRWQVWQIFVQQLQRVTNLGFQVHGFVLMSNHYHLLATATKLPVDKIMARVLKGVSDCINRRTERINHVFGGPYKWTIIESPFHFQHALRYIYQNPVRAGLTSRVEQYEHSTVNSHFARSPEIPVACHPFEGQIWRKFSTDAQWKSWLNEIYDSEHSTAIRRALYHRKFKFRVSRSSRRMPFQFRDLTK